MSKPKNILFIMADQLRQFLHRPYHVCHWHLLELLPHQNWRLDNVRLFRTAWVSLSDWPDFVVCETGYAGRMARHFLGLEPWQCRGYMIRSQRWKYILWEGFAPQLFDLENDPNEFVDLGVIYFSENALLLKPSV